MTKEFTVDDIKALGNFKKLSKLGWSIVSTQRQLKNKTIVLDHELFQNISTVMFVRFPYVVDGFSETSEDGDTLKYTRNQNAYITYPTSLTLEQFFTKAFDYIIQTFKHNQKFLIKVKDYDKYCKIIESKPIFVSAYTDGINLFDHCRNRDFHSKLSTVDHMLEFPEPINHEIYQSGVRTMVDIKKATTLHISMAEFNYLGRYYDNIIFKKNDIRLNKYEKAREKSGEYSKAYMNTIHNWFNDYEEEFKKKIDSIQEIIDAHPNTPINYHKPKIKKSEDLWIVVNDKMKSYKEHLAKIKNYKDYRFFKEIVNILDVKILTDIKAFQAGDQFGFFED